MRLGDERVKVDVCEFVYSAGLYVQLSSVHILIARWNVYTMFVNQVVSMYS